MREDKVQDGMLSARRRLVRGVFAAPAALTLQSGSVAARSIKNCVTKQVAFPVSPDPGLNANNATWVRVQLRRFQGQRNGFPQSNRQSRWIRGSDVVALQAVNTSAPYLTSTQWQLYDRTTTSSGNCNQLNPASNYASQLTGFILSSTPTEAAEAGTISCNGGSSDAFSDVFPGGTPDQWVALKVDSTGKIIGAVPFQTGGSAIAQTCWASFRVG